FAHARLDHRPGGIDEIDRDAGHSKSSIRTVSPTATSPRGSSSTIRQLPAVIEDRIPEPCGPVGRASQPPVFQCTPPRLNSPPPFFLLSASTATASAISGKRRRRPASL